MANKVSTHTPAPGLVVPSPTVATPSGGLVPWRKATLRKAELAAADTVTLGANQQLMNRVLEGTGFLANVDIQVSAVNAANTAAVTFAADAPWNVLQNVVFKDVGPDLVNLSGYSLYLANLYGGYGLRDKSASTDPSIFSTTAGAGLTGGSFNFHLRVPLAINNRSLIGIMGNQDRAVKYELRTDVSPIASIYGVATDDPPAVTIQRMLDFCTVPAPTDSMRIPQEQLPPHYGVLHMLHELRSEADPVTGATVNHFLRGIGNTIRSIILVFRDSTGARSDAMLPNRINFRVGNDVVFSETPAYRRFIMLDQFGFDAPAGVLAYNFCADFGHGAGFELGDDWLDTRNVANAQFECSYPTFANTPGSLTIITDSLVIPDGMDISAYV
jgi:hypothetical protein